MSELEMIVTAAAQMRTLADAADPGNTWFRPEALVDWGEPGTGLDETVAHHIAAWSPQMARKVADLLDYTTRYFDGSKEEHLAAVALAKTWLGVE